MSNIDKVLAEMKESGMVGRSAAEDRKLRDKRQEAQQKADYDLARLQAGAAFDEQAQRQADFELNNLGALSDSELREHCRRRYGFEPI